MKGYAVVATHHKTGTVWMRRVFQRIGKEFGLRFIPLSRQNIPGPEELRPPAIVFDNHSEFHGCRWLLEMPECRLFHLIRDPRDMIISAAHYHRIAQERWLRWGRPEFGGKTYQQMIENQPDDRSRYLFEMDHSAKESIGAMMNWDYSRPNSFECKYEQLITDADGSFMSRAFRHLGFNDDEIAVCLDVFRNSSRSVRRQKHKGGHIRSGQACQWVELYDRALAEEFVARFGNVLLERGYETGPGWLHNLPVAKQAAQGPNLRPRARHADGSRLS